MSSNVGIPSAAVPSDRAEFAGRRILITGGASGIGLATARLLASRGATVALIDRDARVAAAAQDLGCASYVADVRDEAAVAAAVNAAARGMTGLDGLVNCAGVVAIKPIEDTTLGEWMDIISINLTGTFLVCRAAVPWLRKAKGATIVNVGSAQALLPTANATAYAASKGGVVLFTKSLAAELAPVIRVNSVCPGVVDTPMHLGLHAHEDADAAKRFLARYPLGRKAEAIEVAQAIAFLTGPASSYITCSALAVDGGRCFH